MNMRCAECGCLVDAGQVVERCGNPECCCRDLPDKSEDESHTSLDRAFRVYGGVYLLSHGIMDDPD